MRLDSVRAPGVCLSLVQGHKNGSSHSLNSKSWQLLTGVRDRFLPFSVFCRQVMPLLFHYCLHFWAIFSYVNTFFLKLNLFISAVLLDELTWNYTEDVVWSLKFAGLHYVLQFYSCKIQSCRCWGIPLRLGLSAKDQREFWSEDTSEAFDTNF